MKKIFDFIKKQKVILVSVGAIIVLIIALILIISSFMSKVPNGIILTDNLDLEINSEVRLYSLVTNEEGFEIVTEDTVIDTSKLGEQEISIKYLNFDKKEKTYNFKINVVDTIAPNIECDKEVTVALGGELDLLNNVVVTDNSKEEIVPIIEGAYDLNVAGEYNLKFVVEDNSGNKSAKDFTLIVKSVEIKTKGYYVYKTSDTWHEVTFDKDGTFMYLPWFCPGSGCGGYVEGGTYTVKGNKIYAEVTYTVDDVGDRVELETPGKWEFTIVDENKLISKGHTFKWQKTFQG